MQKLNKQIQIALFIIICIQPLIFKGQNAPMTIDQPNPHRGLYIDHFFQIDPVTWGAQQQPYIFRPASSILGTDIDHDGIFEKEDSLLRRCKDNHITCIILLDLHYLIGNGIQI